MSSLDTLISSTISALRLRTSMALLTCIKLEEQEVSEAETRMIQCFATDAVAEHPEDPLANALNLVVEHVSSVHQFQMLRENTVSGTAPVDYGDLPLNPAKPELSKVSDELTKAWHVFQQELDDEQRQKQLSLRRGLRKLFSKTKRDGTSPVWRVDGAEGQPLGIQDIIKSVEDAQSYWRSKPRLAHGRAQACFHTFCRTLDTHSNLMDCLPSQSQYMSVFCGATTALIKASVNHQNVAEGLSESLSDISGSLADCEKNVKLMNNSDMREAISSIYAHVFHFLHSAIKWYQARAWRKVLDSLTENFSDSLKAQVAKIQKMCSLIRQESQFGSQLEIRTSRILLEQLTEKLEIAREDERQARQEQENSAAISRVLGQRLMSVLLGNTQAWLHKEGDSPPKQYKSSIPTQKLIREGEVTPKERMNSTSITTTTTSTRSEMQQWSADLEDFTSITLDFLNLIECATAFADLETVEAVRDWSQAITSQALWIRGQFEETHPSNVSAIAVKVINTVRRMSIPVLAFFFHLDDENREENGEDLGKVVASPCKSQEASLAVDCLYSLIRQLINQLPRHVELPGKNWKTRFNNLDGSLETFDTALKILEQLLQQAPDTLLIIVDGVEQVDDSEAQQPVSEILLLLQQMTLACLSSQTQWQYYVWTRRFATLTFG